MDKSNANWLPLLLHGVYSEQTEPVSCKCLGVTNALNESSQILCLNVSQIHKNCRLGANNITWMTEVGQVEKQDLKYVKPDIPNQACRFIYWFIDLQHLNKDAGERWRLEKEFGGVLFPWRKCNVEYKKKWKQDKRWEKGPKSISTVPPGPMKYSPLPMIINPDLGLCTLWERLCLQLPDDPSLSSSSSFSIFCTLYTVPVGGSKICPTYQRERREGSC